MAFQNMWRKPPRRRPPIEYNSGIPELMFVYPSILALYLKLSSYIHPSNRTSSIPHLLEDYVQMTFYLTYILFIQNKKPPPSGLCIISHNPTEHTPAYHGNVSTTSHPRGNMMRNCHSLCTHHRPLLLASFHLPPSPHRT